MGCFSSLDCYTASNVRSFLLQNMIALAKAICRPRRRSILHHMAADSHVPPFRNDRSTTTLSANRCDSRASHHHTSIGVTIHSTGRHHHPPPGVVVACPAKTTISKRIPHRAAWRAQAVARIRKTCSRTTPRENVGAFHCVMAILTSSSVPATAMARPREENQRGTKSGDDASGSSSPSSHEGGCFQKSNDASSSLLGKKARGEKHATRKRVEARPCRTWDDQCYHVGCGQPTTNVR